MITVGTVWDRTTEVIGGRSGMLAAIAALALFLPSAISDAWTAYTLPATRVTLLVGAILALVSLVATIWGQLAIIAVATDPETTRRDAGAHATARLLPALGLLLVLTVALMLASLPIFLVLAASGADFSAGMTAETMPAISPGAGMFMLLYALVLLVLTLWIAARLALINPVILRERLGLGAIRRSIALTRGYTGKLIGLILLFLVVMLISASAAQLITGVVFRLILGEGATAPFLAQVAVQAVTTGFTVVAAVFTAQLYLALREPVAAPE